jgi:primary-amine oxidase
MAPMPLSAPLRFVFLTTAILATACRREGVSSHPLDPLTMTEIDRAHTVLADRGLLGGSRRVSVVDLLEPPKADVLAGRVGPRKAFVVLYDPARNATSEAVVNVDDRSLESVRDVPGAEPRLDATDADVAESVTRSSDAWKRALTRRGLSPGDVKVDAWSAGNFGEEDPSRGRLVRAVTSVRAASTNEMSRPIDGLVVLVDVAAHRVVDVQDTGDAPVPSAESERAAWRPLPRPTTPNPPAVTVDEPAVRGAGIDVNGHAVAWRRWRLHVALRPREGLVLYGVGFDDGTAVRSVIYRASLSEMVVPYGDPGPGWYFRNSFDVGELGIGVNVSSLVPGIDCPKGSAFLEGVLASSSGESRRVARAIAVYERDGGLAWSHAGSGARARELVVLSLSRLGNYDYGFEWTFHEDGTISHRALLTGVMAAKAAGNGAADSLASTVAAGVAAVEHQHFFNYRIDLDVDGASPNRVAEIEAHALASGASNAHGGAFAAHQRTFSTERDVLARGNDGAPRTWRVTNPTKRNALGEPTGYELVPGALVQSLADSASSIRHRAGFLDAPLWVTPQADSERWAAGDYPNQSRGDAGLARWTRANRSVLDTDVVLWFTLGVTHNPRPEDWPVMPVHAAGFSLVPVGFFDRNPTLGPP